MNNTGVVRNSFFSDKMEFHPIRVRAMWLRTVFSGISPERKRIRYLRYKIADKIGKLAEAQNRYIRSSAYEEILVKQIEKSKEEINLLEELIGLRGNKGKLNFLESLKERGLMIKVAILTEEANDRMPNYRFEWSDYLKLLE